MEPSLFLAVLSSLLLIPIAVPVAGVIGVERAIAQESESINSSQTEQYPNPLNWAAFT